MPGIKDCLTDVLAKLVTLQVMNQDNNLVSLHARIWNNQVDWEKAGKLANYPKPAAFVEVVSPARYEIIGQGYRDTDLALKIHLIHEFYDAVDGTMEQDLVIFDLRDQILVLLSFFTPAGCGPMMCMTESQDYTHSMLYHYTLDFVCNFTDSKGSPLDPARTVYTPADPPLELEVDFTNPLGQGGGQLNEHKFLFNTP